MSKKIAVLIRNSENQYEGLRTSLGLQLEDHQVDMFVLNEAIEPTEEYLDNMGFVDEMGGKRFSNVAENIEKHGFGDVSIQQLAEKLKDYDLIIPY